MGPHQEVLIRRIYSYILQTEQINLLPLSSDFVTDSQRFSVEMTPGSHMKNLLSVPMRKDLFWRFYFGKIIQANLV